MLTYILTKFINIGIVIAVIALVLTIGSLLSKRKDEHKLTLRYFKIFISLFVVLILTHQWNYFMQKDIIRNNPDQLKSVKIEVSKQEYLSHTYEKDISNENTKFYKEIKVFKDDANFDYVNSIDEETIASVHKPIYFKR